MRRLCLVLMIVLLPLRAWAGDFMGLQMATMGMAPQAVAAMPADCPMRAQPAMTDAAGDASAAPAGMEACSACDLCLPMAEPGDTRLETVCFASHAQPSARGAGFVSAPRALAFKPPTS